MKEKLRLCKRIRPGIRVLRNIAQNGQQHEKWSESAPEIGIHLALHVVRNAKGYNFWAVLSWRLLLCYAYDGGPQFTVSSPMLKIITNQMPNQWTRSVNIYERCSLFPPHYMRFLQNTQKQETRRLKTGSIFGREKNKTPNFETELTKTHNNYFEPGRWNGILLRGRFRPKQREGGGTRNESGGVRRSRRDLPIGILLGVCTLHLLSIKDGASVGIRPIDGVVSRL